MKKWNLTSCIKTAKTQKHLQSQFFKLLQQKRFTPQQEAGLMSEGIMKVLCRSIHIFSYFQNYYKKRGNYKPFYFVILTTLIIARQNVMRECHIS